MKVLFAVGFTIAAFVCGLIACIFLARRDKVPLFYNRQSRHWHYSMRVIFWFGLCALFAIVSLFIHFY